MTATDSVAGSATGLYQLLPPLSDDDLAALRADIQMHGVKVPVEYDEAGNILDGHHRVAICGQLGITDWPRFVRKGLTEDGKRAFARSLNLARRHMSSGQKQVVIKAQLKDTPALSSRAIAAKLGVDHKTVAAARGRLASTGEIPQLERTLGRDGRERGRPMKTMFLPDRQNVPELKRVAKAIRTQEMAASRAVRVDLVASIASRGKHAAGEMPRNAYPIIYADPPWEQKAYSDETGQDRGLMYPSMSVEEIMALCAGDKSPATQSAQCFLWVTANHLEDGFAVLKAWGFRYSTGMVWDKVDIGMGRDVRDRHEHLLIGKRGPISIAPLPGDNPPSLYAEKKTTHSRKPVWFAEQIDRQWPTLPKLELFNRRESLVVGDVRLSGKWDFWGFEAAQAGEAVTDG